MIIICDTREQRNSHILAEFSKQNIQFCVKGLKFGDYSFKVDGISYENKVIIEKKNSLTELAGSLCQGRKRFENEFIRATEAGSKIYLLIEDEKGRDKLILRREFDNAKTVEGKKEILVKMYTAKENAKRKCKEDIEKNIEKYKKGLETIDVDEIIKEMTWRSNFCGNSMIGSIRDWKERYGFEIIFADKKDSGKVILDIFNKYLDATQ